MGKFLRVLVVFIFILSIAALTLGTLLFVKREILKGRTNKLEQGLIRLARTLESEAPVVPETPAVYPERDVSAVTAEILDNPTQGQFWEKYRQEYESLDQPVVDLNPKRRDLMSYYKIDPITSSPERDPITNLKKSDGPGTTQGVIDYVIEKAGEQYNLLTATRQQLQITRAELVETIKDLNQQKMTLRERLVHIVKLNNDIAELNRIIEGLRRELQQANERIEEQKVQINDLEQAKLALEEKVDSLTIKTEELQDIIKGLRGQIDDLKGLAAGTGGGIGVGEGTVSLGRMDIAAGAKGNVVSVDAKYLFVVMELDQKFVDELLGTMTDGRLPMVDLLIQRGGGEGKPKFVTKVRLTQLQQEKKLAIGEILTDWQQDAVEPGDSVFYQ